MQWDCTLEYKEQLQTDNKTISNPRWEEKNNSKEIEVGIEAPGEGTLHPYSVDTYRKPRTLEAENNEERLKTVEVES